jgi:hypothetical protein
MTKRRKELLMALSNEQLIYLIEQMNHSLFLIGETCVTESKGHIETTDAIRRIRDDIYDLPSLYTEAELKAYIDMKMGKITPQEYRKRLGYE